MLLKRERMGKPDHPPACNRVQKEAAREPRCNWVQNQAGVDAGGAARTADHPWDRHHQGAMAREAAVQLGANQGRLWASRSSSKIDLLWKGVPIDLPRAIYLGIFEGPKVDVGAVRRYHSDRHDQLRQDLGAFLDAYNFGKRLKTLKGLAPFEAICEVWTKEPDRFKLDPTQLTPGLHT